MNFKPLWNYILVRPIEVSNTTKSGLVLPEGSVDKPNRGKVVAIGDGQLSQQGETIPVRVSIENNVLFPKYSGIEIKLEDIRYILIRDTELLGTFD